MVVENDLRLPTFAPVIQSVHLKHTRSGESRTEARKGRALRAIRQDDGGFSAFNLHTALRRTLQNLEAPTTHMSAARRYRRASA